MIPSESETKENSQPNKSSSASETHFGRQIKNKATEMNLPKHSAQKRKKTQVEVENTRLESDAETSKYFVEKPLTNKSMLMKKVKVVLQRLKVDLFGEEQNRRNKMLASESETKENREPKKMFLASKTHFGRRSKRKAVEINLGGLPNFFPRNKGKEPSAETSKTYVETPSRNKLMPMKKVKVFLQRKHVKQIGDVPSCGDEGTYGNETEDRASFSHDQNLSEDVSNASEEARVETESFFSHKEESPSSLDVKPDLQMLLASNQIEEQHYVLDDMNSTNELQSETATEHSFPSSPSATASAEVSIQLQVIESQMSAMMQQMQQMQQQQVQQQMSSFMQLMQQMVNTPNPMQQQQQNVAGGILQPMQEMPVQQNPIQQQVDALIRQTLNE
jgi:hypothetical protein